MCYEDEEVKENGLTYLSYIVVKGIYSLKEHALKYIPKISLKNTKMLALKIYPKVSPVIYSQPVKSRLKIASQQFLHQNHRNDL